MKPFIYRKNMKFFPFMMTAVLTALCLCFCSCSSSDDDDEDEFISVDFDSKYSVYSDKSFSLILSDPAVTVRDSGTGCSAVSWEGEMDDDEYFYGFMLKKISENFKLCVWFQKPDDNDFYGKAEREEGQYGAYLRYGNKMFSSPSGKLSLTVYKLTGTKALITLDSPVTFTYPSVQTVSASDYIILRSY